MRERGELVRLYLSSADVSTAAAVVLRNSENAAVTLANKDRLVITSLHVWMSDGGAGTYVTLFADANDDGTVDSGEEILRADATVSVGLNDINILIPQGISLKAKADDAGQVNVWGTGYVIQS